MAKASPIFQAPLWQVGPVSGDSTMSERGGVILQSLTYTRNMESLLGLRQMLWMLLIPLVCINPALDLHLRTEPNSSAPDIPLKVHTDLF